MFAKWYANKGTKELLTDISSDIQIRTSDLIIVSRGGELHEHTWAHRYVVYHIAMWISSKFYVKVLKWLDELFTTGSVTLGKEKSCEEIESRYMTKIQLLESKLSESVHDLKSKEDELQNYDVIHYLDIEQKTINAYHQVFGAHKHDRRIDKYIFYVLWVGTRVINGVMYNVYKYGVSKSGAVRMSTHRASFGHNIKKLYIQSVTYGSDAETLIEKYLESHDAIVDDYNDLKKCHQVEIFRTRPDFKLHDILIKCRSICDKENDPRRIKCINNELGNVITNQKQKIEDLENRLKDTKDIKRELDETRAKLAQQIAEIAALAAKVQVYEHLIQNVVPIKKDARDAATNTDAPATSDCCAQTELDAPEPQESQRAESDSDSEPEEEEASAEADQSVFNSEPSDGPDESEAELEADEDECEDENSKEAAAIQKLPSIKPYRRSNHKKNPPIIKRCETCGRDNQEFYKSRSKCNECMSIDLQTERRIENPELYAQRDEQAALDAKGLRRCGKSSCNKVKPKSAFHNMKKDRFGKALWCKACSKEARQKNYEKERAQIDPNLKQNTGSALYYIKDGAQSVMFESMTKLATSINIDRKIISKCLKAGQEYNGYKFIKVTKKQYYYVENGKKSRGYDTRTEFSKAVHASDRVIRKYISTKAEYRGRTFLFE